MKNFIIYLLLVGAGNSYAKDDIKCLKQVDKEVKALNMGSFEHPSTCTNKGPGAIEGSHILGPSNADRHVGMAAFPKLTYSDSKNGPIVVIHSKDLRGGNESKVVQYDENCKTKEIIFTSSNAAVPTLTLNKKSCEQFIKQEGISHKVGIKNPNMHIVAICKDTEFSNSAPQEQYCPDCKKDSVNSVQVGK